MRAEAIGTDIGTSFREAAREVAGPQQGSEWMPDTMPLADAPSRDRSGATAGAKGDDGVGLQVGFSVGSFLDSLFFDLVGEGPRPYQPSQEEVTQFRAAADDALKQQQQRERDDADEEWRERQRSSSGG